MLRSVKLTPGQLYFPGKGGVKKNKKQHEQASEYRDISHPQCLSALP